MAKPDRCRPISAAHNYETVRARVDRLTVVNESFTDLLATKPDASVDRFILLDAQDWMSDRQLNELWTQITRTAAPCARVIFRTAAEPTLLPGRVDDALLARWDYREAESRAQHQRDRSSIYGGFHLYLLKEQHHDRARPCRPDGQGLSTPAPFLRCNAQILLIGRDPMLAGLDVPEGGTVLEIGCGTGRNLVKAGRLYQTAKLFGIDISREMLVSAGKAVFKAGIERRSGSLMPTRPASIRSACSAARRSIASSSTPSR